MLYYRKSSTRLGSHFDEIQNLLFAEAEKLISRSLKPVNDYYRQRYVWCREGIVLLTRFWLCDC